MKLLLALLATLVGCNPPPTAAVSRCEQTPVLAIGEPWHCTVEVQRLEGEPVAFLSTTSRNQEANVKARFTITKGKMRATIEGTDGKRTSIEVSPDAPQELTARVRLSTKGAFSVRFEPVDGHGEGAAAVVDYDTKN